MNRKTVRAFAPASISCFFKLYKHKSPRWAGSYGVGFTVDKGVIATVSKSSKTSLTFNKKTIPFPTVRSVVKTLTDEPVHIAISSPLPLGCGFGLSGASALATAYAVNKLLRLGYTNKELAIIAHSAEVENKTGLGDVVNQYYGGFLLKRTPSSQFIIEKLSLTGIPVYYAYFSPLSTKAILANKHLGKNIDIAADKALAALSKLLEKKKQLTFADAITVGKQFVTASGLLRDNTTKETIAQIEKESGHASMIVLGNAVYSDVSFPGAMKLRISDRRARLL